LAFNHCGFTAKAVERVKRRLDPFTFFGSALILLLCGISIITFFRPYNEYVHESF